MPHTLCAINIKNSCAMTVSLAFTTFVKRLIQIIDFVNNYVKDFITVESRRHSSNTRILVLASKKSIFMIQHFTIMSLYKVTSRTFRHQKHKNDKIHKLHLSSIKETNHKLWLPNHQGRQLISMEASRGA